MYYTNAKLFYVNSKNKINSTDTDSDFSYKFDISPTDKFNRVVLLDISIPKSYYIIDGQSVILDENGQQVNITLTPGNYNRQSFSKSLQYALSNNSPNNWTYNITYKNLNNVDGDDGKLIYSVSGNTSQPKFIFNGSNSLCEKMGFEKNNEYSFISDSLTSVYCINLSGENTLFLKSDICQNDNNILQNIITTSENSYGYINFNNPMPREYSKIFVPFKKVYHFRLCDENDNIINLNGQNMIFTIMMYNENNIYDLVKNFIFLKTMK